MQQGYHPEESQSRQLLSREASGSFTDHQLVWVPPRPPPPPFSPKVFKKNDLGCQITFGIVGAASRSVLVDEHISKLPQSDFYFRARGVVSQ